LHAAHHPISSKVNLVTMSQNGKTTILFVNKGPSILKPIQVSNKLLLNWKKYLAVLSLFFCSLLGIIVCLIINNIQQSEFQEKLSKKLNRMHSLLAAVDTNAARKKFTSIDQELSVINNSLKARGIQTALKSGKNDFSSFETTDQYERYLDQMVYNISYTPLGLPFHGPITSKFGQRENPFGADNIETHKGMDIKGPMGGPVKATAKGTVQFAGQKNGFGNCIILKHGNGFTTLYGHLSKILVATGEHVEIGQKIGLIGSTGRSTGPHLHYEIHRDGQRIDPESFLTLN
jgi:murein DD-endopeptidase MepM/ murein hydrolase activator NlpD